MTGFPRLLADEEQSEIDSLIATLSLSQKAALSAGRDMWGTVAVPSAGIPSWRMTDGPNGARGTTFGASGVRALCMPAGSALAATWDVALIEQVGVALGREARARSARMLLGPTVNIQRSPLAGRTFECFSEDPLLAGKIAAAYIRGVQSQGVVSVVKHFAGNEAEFDRNSINSIIDERTLREVYLAPFEIAVKEGGALGVMTAYNRLNGTFCPDNSWLLGDVLRGEWKFGGIVLTDWWGLVDTVQAATAGLDIEMPGPGRAFGPALAQAVEKGDVPSERLDEIVRRILRVMTRMDARADPSDGPESEIADPAPIALARRAAADAMVLVKNDKGLLPLSSSTLRRVAIIGPNADRAEIMGGGSASLRAQHLTAPLTALREALAQDRVEVEFEQGCPFTEDTLLEATEMRTPDDAPGMQVSFHAGVTAEGPALRTERVDTTSFVFMGEPAPGVPAEAFFLRGGTAFIPGLSGKHRFRLTASGVARLIIDGAEQATIAWDDAGDAAAPQTADVELDLIAGKPVDIVMEFCGSSATKFCAASLTCQRPTAEGALEKAVAAAARADTAIVIVGTSASVESEGTDRTDLSLPRDQNELLERVLAVNPRTVVVVNTGAPILMPWLAKADCVLQTWFGGQEMAAALADVLLGRAEPGGRMPITVPHRVEHIPSFGNFPGEAGEVRYGEGLLVGYKGYEARHILASVPFGHGLGYTRFDWTGARLDRSAIAAGEPVSVSLDVTNIGDRPGSDVVQIYVAPPAGSVIRPVKQLQGFAKVHLAPRETRRVTIVLEPRCFSYWYPGDEASSAIKERLTTTPFASIISIAPRQRGWAIDAGEYAIHVARSSTETAVTLPLTINTTIEGILP